MAKTKLKLLTREINTDITDTFEGVLLATVPLREFHEHITELVNTSAPDAVIGVSLESDDYDCSWWWTLTEQRQETVEEAKERIAKEKEREKREKQWEARLLRDEKKEYLRLKKKFEGK
jgi:hypothetical protein